MFTVYFNIIHKQLLEQKEVFHVAKAVRKGQKLEDQIFKTVHDFTFQF